MRSDKGDNCRIKDYKGVLQSQVLCDLGLHCSVYGHENNLNPLAGTKMSKT